MNASATQLDLAISQHTILHFLLILARVGALVASFPLFSRRQVPFTIKAGLAVALTIFWAGSPTGESLAGNAVLQTLSTGTATVLLIRELFCGLLLGMVTGWILIPARIAGNYIGQELGLTMGQMLDPQGMDSSSDLARLTESAAMVLFFLLNLHHWLLLALHYSFEVVGQNSSISQVPFDLVTQLAGSLERHGLVVAAPVAICLAIINFGVLYLNKASPSMNLFTVGAPIRLISGIIVLLLFWPLLVANIEYSFGQVEQALQAVFRKLAG